MKTPQTITLKALAAILFAGCAVPTYHLPGGFSSSYHRHLNEFAAARSQGMLGPKIQLAPVGGIAAAQPPAVGGLASGSPPGVERAQKSVAKAAEPSRWMAFAKPMKPAEAVPEPVDDRYEQFSAPVMTDAGPTKKRSPK